MMCIIFGKCDFKEIYFIFAAKRCPHLAKGLNLNQLKKALVQGPTLQECADCAKVSTEHSGKDSAEPPSKSDQPVDEAPVPDSLPTETENSEGGGEDDLPVGAQICLQCGHRGCGRAQKQHALAHYRTPHSLSHDLVVDSVTWMTWCYKCDDFVTCDSPRLTHAIDYIRKQSGLTGKPVKIPLGLKRSQSQFCDGKEPSKSEFSSSQSVSFKSYFRRYYKLKSLFCLYCRRKRRKRGQRARKMDKLSWQAYRLSRVSLTWAILASSIQLCKS